MGSITQVIITGFESDWIERISYFSKVG